MRYVVATKTVFSWRHPKLPANKLSQSATLKNSNYSTGEFTFTVRRPYPKVTVHCAPVFSSQSSRGVERWVARLEEV